jgi:hypothetical protein
MFDLEQMERVLEMPPITGRPSKNVVRSFNPYMTKKAVVKVSRDSSPTESA